MLYFLFLFALVNGQKPGKALQPVINNKTAPGKPIAHQHKTLLDKVVANPKQFVAEVQNLDPAALRTIITLLEDLLTTSEERETTLNDAVSDADSAVSDAANGVADAEDVLTNKQSDVTDAENHLATTKDNAQNAISAAEAALAEAEQAEAEAQNGLDDAKADHTSKVSDHEEAESNRGGEIEGLNHEQEVLREIIAMLEGLHETTTGGGDIGEFGDSSCVTVTGDSFLASSGGWGCGLCGTTAMVTSFTEGPAGFGFTMPDDHVLHIMIGLNAADNACGNPGYGMNWGLCLRGMWGNQGIQIYDQNGGGITPSDFHYAAGDSFEVVVTSENSVDYRRNGEVVYTSTGSAVNLPLAFDFSAYTVGGSITNLHTVNW